MSQNSPDIDDPEVLRAQIAQTRAELSANVDTLAETANPKNIAGRQVDKVKSAARGVREHLMGAPDDAGDSGTIGDAADSVKGTVAGAGHAVKDTVAGAGDAVRSTVAGVQDRASDAVEAVGDAPQQVRRRAQGNPLAAGLIAFGVGYLISAAIPSTARERRVTEQLEEKVAPLKEKVTEAAGEVAERLREPAQEAAASLKEAATDAVAEVKEQGMTARDDVQGQVQQSASTVKDTASSGN